MYLEILIHICKDAGTNFVYKRLKYVKYMGAWKMGLLKKGWLVKHKILII